MTTREIADRLVALCREGKNATAIEELYAKDVVSLEANEPMKEVTGLDGVMAKNKWWSENHEVHGGSVEGPFVNGDQFVVRFHFEVTPKATGKRTNFDEVGLYQVKGDKIVHETFLY